MSQSATQSLVRAVALNGGVMPFAEPGVQPHYAPDRSVRLTHIDLHLSLSPVEQTFCGTATLRFEHLASFDGTVRFDLDEVEVHSVTTSDGPCDYHYADGVLAVRTDALAVEVQWTGANPTRGLFFTGPNGADPDRQHMAWTQCQDEDGHFVFPCHDHPGIKHPWSIRIDAPEGYTLLSNGASLEQGVHEGRAWSTWAVEQPMPAYLFTAVAADLHTTEATWRGRPVRYLVPKGTESAVGRTFAKTPLMIEHFSNITGFDYAWPRYDQVVVHDFIFGGMENVACTTMADLLLVDEHALLEWDPDILVAHELAHQWFGNVVTCQDWSQGWLNESWATFLEAVWWEHDRSAEDAIWYRYETMGSYLGEYGSRYRRGLVDYRFREPLDLFDRHLYQKGSCVLWTLRNELGADAFWAGTKRYLHDNAHTAVHSRDFQRAMERETGRNLDGFFHQWVDAPSHPQLTVKVENEDGLLVVTVDQTQTDEGAPQAYAFTLPIDIVTDVGTTTIRLPVKRRTQSFALPVQGTVKACRIDPGLNILATHTWKAPLSMLVALVNDGDPVIAARASDALVAQGSVAALEAVRKAFDTHPHWGARAHMASALGKRGGPEDEAALIERLELDDDPRVRRASAAALGAFRTESAADALLQVIDEPLSTWQLLAAALKSLGSTRDARATEVLESHLAMDSWAETVRSRSLVGLAERHDASTLDALLAHSQLSQTDRCRAAAAAALGTLGKHVESTRDAVLERVLVMVREPGFRSQLAALRALATLGDARALSELSRVHRSAPDGRTRRAAYEAKYKIESALKGQADISALRARLDKLEEENAHLRSRVERLEPHSTDA